MKKNLHYISLSVLLLASNPYAKDNLPNSHESHLSSLMIKDNLHNKTLNELSDEQKAGQLLLVYYTDAEFALENEFGGVLLMGPAFRQAEKLPRELQKLKTSAHIRPWIAIDHEGGLVNRLKSIPGWETTLPAETLGKLTSESINSHTDPVAKYLKHLGINLNLAPVLDPAINQAGEMTWMGQHQRSFGHSPETISIAASAFISSFSKQGICSITKHFPGYIATQNSDTEKTVTLLSASAIERLTEPFKHTADEACGTVMSSIYYGDRSGLPAALSPEMVEKARQIYPNGLLLTDDLWANGLRQWRQGEGESEDDALLAVTRAAILAGNDILMITYPKKAVLMKRAIIQWMKEDANIRRNIDQAVTRILKLKYQ